MKGPDRPANPATCAPGRDWPMGVTTSLFDGIRGLNVAVYARHASAVEFCLFDSTGEIETARISLPVCSDGVWHGFVPGLGIGQRYGLRAHGPWDPQTGQRFNPARLLIDPWAHSLSGPLVALAQQTDYRADAPDQPDLNDNARHMPKARVLDLAAELCAGAAITVAPHTPLARTVLYEVQVKALTALHPEVVAEQRGTFTGVASPAMLAHYQRLGITALCLLPVHLHQDERHLIARGLHNHWGYNTLSFFTPDARFATPAARAQLHEDDSAVRAEFRAMVDALHRHGIEVILDVVYNHTAEGDAFGPSLSWRGLDNASWYALDTQGNYLNASGCGNTLNMGEPRVVQMVMDSLRWWVQAFGVDGFRFDLAVALGRQGAHFDASGPLFAAIAQDPVLAHVKLIAEPWDLGPQGYQIGRFGARWAEWNDQFRDTARAWWLGHPCTPGQLARRMTGSSDLFQTSARTPLASINLITAHDGFTLADLTAYAHKHNQANGEDNRDGHGHNLSANAGHEGPTEDDIVLQLRGQWRRALLATLLCAQGTPQLLAGDELGHSQLGNNNAYCQDNALTWLNWAQADQSLLTFVAKVVHLRQRYPGLRHPHWFSGTAADGAQAPDIEWLTADAATPNIADWERHDPRLLMYCISVGEGVQAARERLLLVLYANNAPLKLKLPDGPWALLLDSASASVVDAGTTTMPCMASPLLVSGPTLLLLVQNLAPADKATP
jgi:glycogen operon protein